MKKQWLWIALLAIATSMATSAETINGAGATFPAPIYQKWFQDFNKAHPDIQINYQSIGSGGGIRQLTEGTVDFGASDMPMTDEQISAIKKYKPLHFPTVLGGVVPTYNISGLSADLKFSGETLAGIFLGTIKSGMIRPCRKTIQASIFQIGTLPWCTVPTAAAPALFGPIIFPK